MPATPTGIPLSSVGMTYDVGIGQNPFTGNTRMYGYMIASGTRYEEATDLQDDQHLVQVASPNASDKYNRYPKISQGDWSGGERQLIFTDPRRYYQSQKLETSLEGHLRIIGKYWTATQPAGTGGVNGVASRTVISDLMNTGGFLVAQLGGASGNLVAYRFSASVWGTAVTRLGPTATATVSELINAYDRSFGDVQGGAAPGIYEYVATIGGTRDDTDNIGTNLNSLTYQGDALFYVSTASPRQVNRIAQAAFPGAGGSQYVFPVLEGVVVGLQATPNGFVVITEGNTAQFGSTRANVYTWDGTNAVNGAVLVGSLVGLRFIDARVVGGTTFLLFAAQTLSGVNPASTQPVIYSLVGPSLAVFDDYRYVASDFQTNFGATAGRLDGDDTFLYMGWPGLNAKRYDLGNNGGQNLSITDVGNPAVGVNTTLAPHLVHVGPLGSFFEIDGTGLGSYMQWGTTTQPNETGYLITSYYDAGVPGVIKNWKSFHIELNAPLGAGASVGVQYRLDNTAAWTDLLPLAPVQDTAGNLIWYFPAGTKASRIQYKITLTSSTAGVSPDIRSFSSFPTAGRIWKFTVWAFHTIQTHAGDDSQGATAGDLIANIMNIYNNGGKAILYVPDPTQAAGVAQVNATLQDYTRWSTSPPGPRADEFEPLDQSAELVLVFSEDL